jgi:hypothetical protein
MVSKAQAAKHSSPALLILEVPDPAPQSRFVEWIEAFGVLPLSTRLGVGRTTVQSWKQAGKYSRTLSPKRALACIALSHCFPHVDGKRLYWQDIYGDIDESEVSRARD